MDFLDYIGVKCGYAISGFRTALTKCSITNGLSRKFGRKVMLCLRSSMLGDNKGKIY